MSADAADPSNEIATHAHRSAPELAAIVRLFYEKISDLGQFEERDEAVLPEPYRKLLAHDKHMTVKVEAHHGCNVDVEVVETKRTETHYSRKILLRRQSDNKVVQFGLVRLNLTFLAPEVRKEIESEAIPLGRVLIEHNVLRNVRLLSLWKTTPSAELCRYFELHEPIDCFGRTALIYCDGIPAVELLEIVTPA